MNDDAQIFQQAEQALLASEGVTVETHHVDLKELGGRSRVLISGEGPPVLFVPGVITGGAVFAGLVGRLPNHRCILLERPGTGLSPLLRSQPTDLAGQERVADAFLVDVLDGLEIDRSHVVSTSMGGWMTFRSVAAHPGRFLRISALGFQVGARVGRVPVWMRAPAAPGWMTPRRLKAPRGMVRVMLKGGGMRSAIESGRFSDELLDWIVALLRHTETFRNEGLHNPRPIGIGGPLDDTRHGPELLARVRSPVHLFWGVDDVFGGVESAREFAELLPDAELQMVPGAGHAPWLDEPELAALAVQRHLGG